MTEPNQPTSPSPDTDGAPVCPRHPGTVAYVRCQRCERPTCPACQVPGAVGIHCVDCARTASSRRRGVRTVLGGRPVADVLVTKILIGACLLVYAVQFALPSLSLTLGFAPVVAMAEPWRFVTTALLHASIMHLAFNMWALWVLGTALEPLLGRWRFTALCLISALGGSTAIYWLASPGSPSWWTLTVGASGAVFGLFATMFLIQRRFGRDTTQIVMLLVLNAVISVVGANISWQGHLGGLLAGGALAAVYAWAPRNRRQAVGLMGTAGLGLLLLALIALRALLV
ncbi:rhomboid family intramembrane serine protease [Actinomyces bowdenii]|uniref:Rhomboid family intramembrane serine protease n=1 Tax=Actinomyces bowdenii TaxID=131109 RepID=A0A853EKH0_9ACTO|nr:rhomboid family intramembrane serine protease [Actinomyces bowdenii]MBF0696173.1 rhomboid family intramembrane serine protease [Actinomyces bowdenii]NYS68346.1 rhomboid family intramembrane serine protease [Actinomyces bowdenii]